MGNHTEPRFTKTDAEIIRRKVRRLVGHYGIRQSDVEDLEQELALHVIQQSHRYRPELGKREAFIETVVKHKILHLIESRTASKRDNRRDVHIETVGEFCLLDSDASQERINLQIDVRDAIARMPEELRQFALLRQKHTEREIERKLGLTRGQVRSRVQRLERFLTDAGLAPDSWKLNNHSARASGS